MARWVDVRIPTGSEHLALPELVKRFAPITLRLNVSPPASGPEVELSVQDVPEVEVRVALLTAGVEVLAIRTRLNEPLVAPEAGA